MAFEEEVQNGIAFLNREHPGWLDQIDLERLSLFNCSECILGQLFGNYLNGLRVLGITAKTFDYGFALQPNGEDLLVDNDDWRALTQEWVKQIRLLKNSCLTEA